MTNEQILSLTREEAWKHQGIIWCTWVSSQPGKYASEAEAEAAAKADNHARVRDLFHYSVSRNRISGWDVCASSCDG